MNHLVDRYDDGHWGVKLKGYDAALVEALRPLARRQGGPPFDGKTKTWIVPALMENHALIGKALPDADWTKPALALLKTAPRIYAEDLNPAEFPIGVVPPGETARPHQVTGVLFALKNRRVLIGDGVAGGKTMQSILACEADPRIDSVLIYCSNRLAPKWTRDIRRWGQRDPSRDAITLNAHSWPKYSIMVPERVNREIARCKYVIASYETLALEKVPWLTQKKWGALVMDECHNLTSSSKRGKAMRRLKAEHLVIALSATPIRNRGVDLHNVLDYISRGAFGTEYQFGMRYGGPEEVSIPVYSLCRACRKPRKGHNGPCGNCGAMNSGYTHFKKVLQFKGISNEGELRERLRAYMIARPSSELLKHLPPDSHTQRIVDLDDDPQLKEYQKLYDACVTDLEKYLRRHRGKSAEEAARAMKAKGLATLNEGRQILARAKVIPMVEDILTAAKLGDKWVVFANHIQTLDAAEAQLQKRLGELGMSIPLFRYTGQETNATARELALQAFWTAPPGAGILCTYGAGGEGLEMQCANWVFAPEHPWNFKDINQACGRIRREGQTKESRYMHYFCSGTIDDHIQDILFEKGKIVTDAFGSGDNLLDVLIKMMDRDRQQSEPVDDYRD